MTRRCLATHPDGGEWPPCCSRPPGHDGPHIADWGAWSHAGRVISDPETWDDEETNA